MIEKGRFYRAGTMKDIDPVNPSSMVPYYIKVQEGEAIEYQIPPVISDRIPEYFYAALAGELFSIYGWERAKDMFYPEEDSEYADLDSGTNGWGLAFQATCKKLDMNWLYEYYQTLIWCYSDVFDGIIEQRVKNHFMNRGSDNTNAYYQYLFEKSRGQS